MTTEQPSMRCPGCGAVMNRHAEKLRQDVDGPETSDDALNGVIEEVYACPRCGLTASRR